MTAETKPGSGAGRLTALLFTAQFIFIWTTFFVLSAAIGWPASLGDPASVALPRMLENETAVAVGYGFYLIAAILIIPAVAALNARLRLSPNMAMLTISLATVSAVAKAIGITRWLFAMPVLAREYVAAGADQRAVATVFDMINSYAGGIGEVLGVGLISGLLTIIIGILVARETGIVARLLGIYTVVAGGLLLAIIPSGFGVELGPLLTLSNIVWQFALLGIGLWALTRRRNSSFIGKN